MTQRQRAVLTAVSLSVLWLAACGGSDTPAAPTPAPTTGPTPTITITASGVNPKALEVPLGSRVRFVNNDSRSHTMSSDPHPDHTDCPEINQAGFLQPGQARETGNLVQARTCGFHDHDNPTNAALRGTITIK